MGDELDPQAVAEALQRQPSTVADAHRDPADGGLPRAPGLYAWWVAPGAIAGVEGPAHPTEDLELLYVGIAPKGPASTATLRSRIRGQHLGGNIGSSTFRQSLAALLFERHGWTTRSSGSHTQLSAEHNRALSEWQRDHLRLAWVERDRPWTVENQVIELMQSPLNLAGNTSHALSARLRAQRAKLRAAQS
jgi:hypothetical protein